MKYLPHDGTIYNTNFTDDILSVEWRESELENDDLKNYKFKAEFYVRQHQDKPTIAKLRFNVPLTAGECRSWRKFPVLHPSRRRNIFWEPWPNGPAWVLTVGDWM